jgi:hypothetical protein
VDTLLEGVYYYSNNISGDKHVGYIPE